MARNQDWIDDEDEDGTSGGTGSAVAFHDFIGWSNKERENLSSRDQNKVIAQHELENRSHIEKQHEKTKQYEDLKNGKRSVAEHRQGMMPNGGFKQHRHFKKDPRKSFVDPNMSKDPSQNTNEANQKEQELRFEKQLQNQLQHRAELKSSPPRLTKR